MHNHPRQYGGHQLAHVCTNSVLKLNNPIFRKPRSTYTQLYERENKKRILLWEKRTIAIKARKMGYYVLIQARRRIQRAVNGAGI